MVLFWCCWYHVSALGAALLQPVELRERQLGGDGGGQRQLVVGAGGALQLQTWTGQTRTNQDQI